MWTVRVAAGSARVGRFVTVRELTVDVTNVALSDAFPDFEVEPIDVFTDERTVLMESTDALTHEGEFEELPPTGREVRMRGMHKFLIERGKVAEHRLYYDLDEFFERLGVSKP